MESQARYFMTGFTRKIQRRNLRPVVLSVSVVYWAWSLFSTIAFFRNAKNYQAREAIGSARLAQLSTVIAALYILLLVILSYGVYATYSLKRMLIRTYAHLSVIITAIVIAAGVLNVSYFFLLKNEIIVTCPSFGVDDKFFPILIGSAVGPITTTLDFTNDPHELGVEVWCAKEWTPVAKINVAVFIVTSLIASILPFFVYPYAKQVLNKTYEPKAVELANHPLVPQHCNPPFNTQPGGQTDADAHYGTPGGLFPGYTPHELAPVSKRNADVEDRKPYEG